jgi:hypothetical protein
MPGYARPTSTVFAQEIVIIPSGTLSSTNLAAALAELDGDVVATNSSVSNISNSLSTKANLVAGGTAITNSNTISENYTFVAGNNAASAGPITIADGVTVTIPTGSEWSIV